MAMTKLGALWKNKNGKDMFSGSIEIDGKKTPLVVFPNGYKEEPKHPDYIIYLSEPKEQASDTPAPKSQDTHPDNPFADNDFPF